MGKARRVTASGREKEMIRKAERLAERQLDEGTASAQVITHYLKLGSERERLERDKLRRENDLLRAKVKNYESVEKSGEFYEKVIQHLKLYSGESREGDDEEEML